MPTALGGKGGGVTTDEELVQWVINRLENFPTLPDLSVVVSTDASTNTSTSVSAGAGAGVGGVEDDLKKASDMNITENSETETVSESGTVNETVEENTVSL